MADIVNFAENHLGIAQEEVVLQSKPIHGISIARFCPRASSMIVQGRESLSNVQYNALAGPEPRHWRSITFLIEVIASWRLWGFE